jgi:hypothetical protein
MPDVDHCSIMSGRIKRQTARAGVSAMGQSLRLLLPAPAAEWSPEESGDRGLMRSVEVDMVGAPKRAGELLIPPSKEP